MCLTLFSPETAGRNHKNVSLLGKKCPVYQICKFVLFLKYLEAEVAFFIFITSVSLS